MCELYKMYQFKLLMHLFQQFNIYSGENCILFIGDYLIKYTRDEYLVSCSVRLYFFSNSKETYLIMFNFEGVYNYYGYRF